MTRYPMTLGTMPKVTTWLTMTLLPLMLVVQLVVLSRALPHQGLAALVVGVLTAVLVTLGVTFALAPRAVRLEGSRLVVERLWWPNFEVSLREVVRAEEGPVLRLWGDVYRVAGNGGLMGFSGLFWVKGVGQVRCWATRLNRPTVLVYRREGRPLLLGVDDAAGLLAGLRAKGVKRQ